MGWSNEPNEEKKTFSNWLLHGRVNLERIAAWLYSLNDSAWAKIELRWIESNFFVHTSLIAFKTGMDSYDKWNIQQKIYF